MQYFKLLRKEMMTRGNRSEKTQLVESPTVLTRIESVEKFSIRKSTNLKKPVVAFDASLLYRYAMLQLLPTGLGTLWILDTETLGCIPQENKTRTFKKVLFFQQKRRDWGTASFSQSGRHKIN